MNWTTAGDLERWADTLDARARLPQLVRKLIFATDSSVVRRDFPAGEGVQRPGWDGILESAAGSEFVPLGISRWEMGVDKDPTSKAEGDFEKRKNDPLGVDQSQTTFVFVTPRKWSKKLEWQQEKQALGIWKDVRVYDSSNLEEWLETALAVDAWLARTTGRRPNGVADIEEHWDNLAAFSNPPLRPQIFLTSRADNIKRFSDWMAGGPSALSIEASSPTEVVDFIAAHVASLEETDQNERAARIIVVESREAWQFLSASKNSLVLVQHPRLVIERELVAQAVRQNHHVILCAQRLHERQGASFELTRPFRHELQAALVDSGLSKQDAARLSRSSGGSLPILKRRISSLPSVSHPPWSLAPDASYLVPLVLAGGWDDSSEEDRQVLAKLAKRPYEEVLQVATRWLTTEDSPLMQIGIGWTLVSHEDAWLLLLPSITRVHLDAFAEVAVEVLGADDPALELPASDRWCAALYEKLPKHSGRLRAGLIETLALLGSKAESAEIQDGVGAANRANFVVRTIVPEDASWQRWATLARFLPLLIEASPEVLLDRFEKDLTRTDSQLLKLFEEEGEPLFGSSPHTGLLWALENLAWEPAYLTRAALILARLARLDPGGKLGNRPKRSLTEIFLCWLPQTEASSEQRIKVIDKLLKKEPDVAWRLLLSLLPDSMGSSSPTHKPSYRNWGMNWSKGVTHAEHAQQVSAVSGRLLANALNSPDRLESLIEQCNRLPTAELDRLLVDLKAIDQSTLNTETRRKLSNKLRDQAHNHRRFAGAHWALPSPVVDELEVIQALFEPDDLSDRYGWLFVQWPHLPNENINWSFQQREAAILDAQSKVARDGFQQDGVAAIFALAKAVPAPGVVGIVFAKLSLLEDEATILPSLLDSDDETLNLLARGFAFGRFTVAGWSWLEDKDLSTWSDEQIVNLAMVLPFGPRTWTFVEARGDAAKRLFWSKTQPFPHDLTTQDIETAANRLIEFGRPLQAADLLCSAMYQKHTFDSSLLFETLEQGLTSLANKAETAEIHTMLAHSLQEVFIRLQATENIDQERLAKLEWNYLPLLDGHATPKALHTWLARDAGFFAEVIKLVYRSQLESEEEQAPPSEELQAKAKNAYSLLESWHAMPGVLDNAVDENLLREWVDVARERCKVTGHIEMCDLTIGKILVRSPAETDGTWPCIAVRNILEDVETAEILRGFETGIANKRGSYSKSMTEGGEQERDFADAYRKFADACKIEWPRTAAVLRSITSYYERFATREDNERNARL